jgi:alpha-1,2-mannosyltransferase
MKVKPACRCLSLILIVYLVLHGAFYVFISCYVVIGSLHGPVRLDLSGKPVGADFVAYWAGARVARNDHPAAVFSREKIYAVEREVVGTEITPMIWNYPPTFLLMVLPLSFLPYLVAFAVWLSVTCLGYVFVIHRILPRVAVAALFLFFPGSVSNIAYGQNGFLSTIFLGGGLVAIDRYPVAGGLLLGLLSYKPQFAPLIPIALIAGRCWKALIGVALAAIGGALASLLILGSSVWTRFFENVAPTAELMDQPHLWAKMPTVFAAMRTAGASHELGMIVQLVTTVGVITAVSWVWFRGADLRLRAAVLACGTVLATPYAFEYDLTMMAPAFAWLGWDAYKRGAIGEELSLSVAGVLIVSPALTFPLGPNIQTGNFPLSQVALVWMLIFAVRQASRVGTSGAS